MTRRLDWLGRVDIRPGESPRGMPKVGEGVVEDVRTGETFIRLEAAEKICFQLPLMFPLGVVLRMLRFFR